MAKEAGKLEDNVFGLLQCAYKTVEVTGLHRDLQFFGGVVVVYWFTGCATVLYILAYCTA